MDIHKPNPLKNGDLGVDIFFVLSGYLISDILIREIEKYGKIDYFHFIRSRFLRIWPALFLVNVYILMLWYGLEEVNFTDIAKILLFLNNFYGLKTWLWTIPVEMQFYLVSPFIVSWMYHGRRPYLIVLGLTLVSVICNYYGLMYADISYFKEGS